MILIQGKPLPNEELATMFNPGKWYISVDIENKLTPF